ncbi:MAG: hypothetical protein DRP02_12630, partial [Candidatus Gerdarchaeota archaeon]
SKLFSLPSFFPPYNFFKELTLLPENSNLFKFSGRKPSLLRELKFVWCPLGNAPEPPRRQPQALRHKIDR